MSAEHSSSIYFHTYMRQTKVKIPAFHAQVKIPVFLAQKNHSTSIRQANILGKPLPDGDIAG
jgi:hypothetical protein